MIPLSSVLTYGRPMPPIARYPSGREYQEALFNTNLCFRDPSLVGGVVTMDGLGMPKPISGASGSVFTVQDTDGRQWAVKCFTRFIDHQAVRYKQISNTLQTVHNPWRVEFEYLPGGVLCAGKWYPVLKMEWLEATSLIPFIEKHLWEPVVIAELAGKFVRMVRELSALDIAHGDLQHGNLLITPTGELKLIDYDGMFVPGLVNLGACEKGHINYQSPSRTMSTWGPYLDNFSAWVIYTSLVALAIDPTLWSLLHSPGDEALLFNHADYLDPRNSRALFALAQSSKPGLHTLGNTMCNVWVPEIRAIPPLNPDDLPRLDEQSEFSASTSSRVVLTAAGAVPGALPDWVTGAQAVTHSMVPTSSGDSSWITGHLPALPPATFSSSRLGVRVLACILFVVIAASSFSAGLGRLPVSVGVLISLLAATIFAIFTMILFRRTPEWQAKRDKLTIFKERRTEASKIAREVAILSAGRQTIDSREQNTVGRISGQADKARTAEQKELTDVNLRLADRIQHLQKQNLSLQSSEDKETANALRLLQEQHVNTHLRAASIISANISGIGPGIIKSLASNGVMTAADFTGIAYSGGPRGGVQQVRIRLRNGYHVHPNGVGEKKAQALDGWRRSLEMKARATQPSRLPSAQAQAIRDKYMQQRQSLANEEQTARAHAQIELRQISQKWMSTHTSLSAELVSARQAFGYEKAQADLQVTAAQKRANALTWQRDLAVREISAHRKISFLRYLSGTIGIFQ
jgi:hypothetical protein